MVHTMKVYKGHKVTAPASLSWRYSSDCEGFRAGQNNSMSKLISHVLNDQGSISGRCRNFSVLSTCKPSLDPTLTQIEVLGDNSHAVRQQKR